MSSSDLLELFSQAEHDPQQAAKLRNLVMIMSQPEYTILCAQRDPPNMLQVSPDSHWMISADQEEPIRIWDLRQISLAASPSTLASMLGDDAKKLTAMSCSGHWFAFPASDGQQVLLADLWSSPPALNRKTLLGNTSPIDVIVFGGHDQWIAAACKDRIVRVWDLRTGSDDTRPLLLQPSKWPIQLSVSDDGRWLAVISNGGEAGSMNRRNCTICASPAQANGPYWKGIRIG